MVARRLLGSLAYAPTWALLLGLVRGLLYLAWAVSVDLFFRAVVAVLSSFARALGAVVGMGVGIYRRLK